MYLIFSLYWMQNSLVIFKSETPENMLCQDKIKF